MLKRTRRLMRVIQRDGPSGSGRRGTGRAMQGRSAVGGVFLGTVFFGIGFFGNGFLGNGRLAAQPDLQGEDEPYVTRIFIINADGSDLKRLTNLPKYQTQGSPCWSRDGKLIAFDAWQDGERLNQSQIVVVNADGTNPRVLIDGAMPAFSPKGNRIAFSRYGQGGGVWIVSSNGPDTELIQLDESAWGTDWSADGRLAFTASQGGGANLVVLDPVEGTREFLFEPGKSPYRQIFWNFTWSPDSRRIAFVADRLDGKHEIAIVDARGAKFGLVTRHEDKDALPILAWGQDRILFGKTNPERKPQPIFFLEPDTKTPPQILPALDPNRGYSEMAYSPDGKKIAVKVYKLKQATEPAPK